jgi:hypothetical protein
LILFTWNARRIAKFASLDSRQSRIAAPVDDRHFDFDASPISYTTRDNNQTAFLLTYGMADDIVDPESQSVA